MLVLATFAICSAIVILLGRWLTIRFIAFPLGNMSDDSQTAAFEAVVERSLAIPTWISTIYMAGVLAFVATIVWSVVTIAWWTLLLAIPLWIAVHFPWRAQSIMIGETNRIVRRAASVIDQAERRQS